MSRLRFRRRESAPDYRCAGVELEDSGYRTAGDVTVWADGRVHVVIRDDELGGTVFDAIYYPKRGPNVPTVQVFRAAVPILGDGIKTEEA